jgi:hypothetical protein
LQGSIAVALAAPGMHHLALHEIDDGNDVHERR